VAILEFALLWILNVDLKVALKKFAIARTRSPTHETRALPKTAEIAAQRRHQLNGSQFPDCGGALTPLSDKYVYSCSRRS
jgi:hypothetical protein